MPYQTFEDILAWQKSKQLSVEVYGRFKDCSDRSFRDQLQRASVSIMNNIAEGYERQTQKELRYFLSIAKGSSGEVRSMLILAKDLNYISSKDFEDLSGLSIETSKLLGGFLKKL